MAFVYLCVQTILHLEDADTFDCLTEGSGDFGIDAMHISEEYDGEFTVSLFQGKYKSDLTSNANFPNKGVKALINAISSQQLSATFRRSDLIEKLQNLYE